MTVKAFIRNNPVLSYFTLTFAISWGTIILVVGGPGGIPVTKEKLDALGPVMYMAMLAGPSIAGLLLTGLVHGRAGLGELRSRLLRWRVGARWYAVALLTAPLLAMALLLALSAFSSEFIPGIFISDGKAALVLSSIMVGLMIGFFEELGWTGFAVPALRRRYSILATGLILGLVWGAWHFLLFWESDTFGGAFPLALLAVRLFSWLPPYRVLMVWVHERTNSLLVVMLMHASLVAGFTFILFPVATGAGILAYLLVWGVALIALVAAVASVDGGQLRQRPAPAGVA